MGKFKKKLNFIAKSVGKPSSISILYLEKGAVLKIKLQANLI